MSHFSVVVCLGDEDGKLAKAAQVAEHGFPDGKDIPAFGGNDGLLRRVVSDRLEAIMAPYDENREVAPYREYEDDGPEGYWLYRSLKRADEDERNGTGILPYKPDALGWGSDFSKETPDEQQLEIARKTALFQSLPEPVTWEALIDVGKILYPEDTDWPELDEEGRAYRISTSNPDSKWDYWRIGGRWGAYFPFSPEFSGEVIGAERGWDSPDDMAPLHCDGGPKRALDLSAKREEEAAKARKAHEEYHAVVDGLPEAQPWSAFRAKLDAVPAYTIARARADYHAQPRVRALEGTGFRYRDDPIGEFGTDISLHAEKARAGAVPGFAVVTVDGKWMAQGHMGWFAATDATDNSRIGYWEAANAYIESLPDGAWLVVVDCHV